MVCKAATVKMQPFRSTDPTFDHRSRAICARIGDQPASFLSAGSSRSVRRMSVAWI